MLALTPVSLLAATTSCEQNEEGRVVGATVKDLLTGRDTHVYARTIINAAGPFSDEVRQLSQVRRGLQLTMS
jgi:glycerol-3-phosphate dehydrogenase